MQNRVTKFSVAAVTALVLASAAKAEVKINDTLSTSGYIVGGFDHHSVDSVTGVSSDKLDLTFAKSSITYSTKPVSATASLWYDASTSKVTFLDAYATYDAGGGFSVTGGRFLSYLGYEAWDPVNMDQISYGSTIFAVPGYHDGVKLDYSDQNIGFGIAALDSVYNSDLLKGDGEFKNSQGLESYISYKGIKDVTIWTGIAYDRFKDTDDTFTWDLWTSYAVSKQLRVAGEIDTQHTAKGTSYGWLAFANYAFDDKVSLTARVSGNKLKTPVGEGEIVDRDSTAFTLSPTYTLSANLLVRGEYTHTYQYGADDDYFGVQAIFKW